jgi:hypothetical protein
MPEMLLPRHFLVDSKAAKPSQGGRALLFRRSRREDLTFVAGLGFRLRLGSLLGFLLALVFVSHA